MVKKIKPKYCSYVPCGKEFVNYNSYIVKYCSYSCQAKASNEKEIDKKIEGFRENLKDHQYWLKKYETVFNEFIRLRDKNEPCISCDTRKNIVYHAGHFFSVGAHPNLRFNEDNVHKQCGMNCNKSKHGNTVEYAIRLVIKIGQERFDKLYADRNKSFKLSIPEIKEKIIYYKQKIKILKNGN